MGFEFLMGKFFRSVGVLRKRLIAGNLIETVRKAIRVMSWSRFSGAWRGAKRGN